jgi:hypothetical protein
MIKTTFVSSVQATLEKTWINTLPGLAYDLVSNLDGGQTSCHAKGAVLSHVDVILQVGANLRTLSCPA